MEEQARHLMGAIKGFERQLEQCKRELTTVPSFRGK